MTAYAAPLADMRFVLDEVVDLAGLARLDGLEAATPEIVQAVLGEAAKLAAEVVAPLNQIGDRQASVLDNGAVRTPEGFKQAYRMMVDGGWIGLPIATPFGGQGLPWAVSAAITEMWESANLAFSLCPALTQGAVEMLIAHGSEELKARYLAKLVSGEWAGTMNLTEPQAGSDLGALKSRAVREGDHYRIVGTKIFVTYGDHDLTDNIIHLMLARTAGAPAGTRGLSCFLVPKRLVDEDGSLGGFNDLKCVSLEHKLGIHASPTAVMSYGDGGGAIGYLVGEENGGLNCMFTMMNSERLMVGMEGLAVTERAYQQALAYALERRQGRPPGAPPEQTVAIIEHPDVRRMLMVMKANAEAMRGVVYMAGEAIDLARHHPEAPVRAEKQALLDLLTPVIKGWCSDLGVEMTSLGIQVHGGMGYIEETGAAQHFRDARIVPIYEGTNGIQAVDLVGRKLSREGGAAVRDFIERMRTLEDGLAEVNVDDFQVMRTAYADALARFTAATDWLLAAVDSDRDGALAGATNYLRMFGAVTGGYVLAKQALAARRCLAGGDSREAFLKAKVATARFYAEQILPQGAALLGPITAGAAALFAIAPDDLSA